MKKWNGWIILNIENNESIGKKRKPTCIVNCPHCGSKLEIENSDIFWYKEIDGGSAPGVTCAVCHKGFDVDGYIKELQIT